MATKFLGSVKKTDSVLITSVNLVTEVTGNLPVGNLGSGTGASSTTAFFGDATWKTTASLSAAGSFCGP